MIAYLIVVLTHDRVQVEEAEKETAGGLLLTEDSKEKPSIGTVRKLLFYGFELHMHYLLGSSQSISM